MPCRTALRAAFLCSAALALPALGNLDATQTSRPPAGFAKGEPPPALKLRLGPDSNACGVTPPVGGAPRSGKAGLVIWLHGGMRSSNREKGFDAHRAWLGFLPSRRYYLASPSAYGEAEWTTPAGLAHIEALIDHAISAYAIDTADINLVGVSDGCLGVVAYSLHGRHVPFRRILISGAPQLVLPVESLAGRPRFAQGRWDFLQGGRDRLFPAEQVFPYLRRFESLYPNATLHAFPDGEHDFSWYAQHARAQLSALFRETPGPAKRAGGSQKTPGPEAGDQVPKRKN